MHREIELRRHELQEPMETVYFGGGTPSLLDVEELNTFLQQIAIAPDAEITIEVNPDDVSTERLNSWQSIGINRVSIGVQSFFDKHLSALGRIHNSQMAESALGSIRKSGIKE